MSFHNQLSALRERASTPSAGLHRDSAVVLRRDLTELLHHFDRLDSEVRSRTTKDYNAELIELLRDERNYSLLWPSCQAGIVERCRCRPCRMARIDAKLATLSAKP